MIKIIERVLTIVLIIVLSGCAIFLNAASSRMEEEFATIVPIDDLNKSLQLKVYGNEQTFSFGSDIPLLVYNKSSHRILFGENSRIKLFVLHGDEWLEVENEILYTGSTLLSPQGTPLLDLSNTWVKPAFDKDIVESDKKETLLRIVMIGEVMKNDVQTGELVGAYVDVYIS
jgi:hypothetical protein